MSRLVKFLKFSACFFALANVSASGAEESKIKFCKPTVTHDGQLFTLGHSLFVEGESTSEGKSIFPTRSVFSPPITHIYDFPADRKARLWIGCNYFSGNASRIEYVEVKDGPSHCVEIMRSQVPNQVQSLTCEFKRPSP